MEETFSKWSVSMHAWHGIHWDRYLHEWILFYWDICMNGFDPFFFLHFIPKMCTGVLNSCCLLPWQLRSATVTESQKSYILHQWHISVQKLLLAWYKKYCGTSVPQPVLASLHLICRKNTCQWGVKAVISSCFPPTPCIQVLGGLVIL